MKYSFYILIILIFSCSCDDNSNESNGATINSETSQNDSMLIEKSPAKYVETSIDIAETDTIKRGECTIYFEPINITNLPDYYPDQEERDKITSKLDNSHKQAMAIENYLAPKFKNIFEATDSTLTLFLLNGQKLELSKEDATIGEGAWYNFINYFPDTEYVLLHVQYGEGNDYMLINRKDGYRKVIRGLPYFSPDKKAILTANVDLDAQYSFNGIEYYKIQSDTLIKVFDLDIAKWGPTKIKWASNQSAEVERYTWRMEENKMIEHISYSKMTISSPIRVSR